MGLSDELQQVAAGLRGIVSGRDAPLYHGTSLEAAAAIGFDEVLKGAGDSKSSGLDPVYQFGVALTRNPRVAENFGDIVLVLDQAKLAQNVKIIPKDYFGGKPGRRSEAEEFVPGNIPNVLRYIVQAYLPQRTIKDMQARPQLYVPHVTDIHHILDVYGEWLTDETYQALDGLLMQVDDQYREEQDMDETLSDELRGVSAALRGLGRVAADNHLQIIRRELPYMFAVHAEWAGECVGVIRLDLGENFKVSPKHARHYKDLCQKLGVEDIKVFDVFLSEIEANYRGYQVGVALYEEALLYAGEKGAVLAPHNVYDHGITSDSAQRVWDSLKKRHRFVGPFIIPPNLAAKQKVSGRVATGFDVPDDHDDYDPSPKDWEDAMGYFAMRMSEDYKTYDWEFKSPSSFDFKGIHWMSPKDLHDGDLFRSLLKPGSVPQPQPGDDQWQGVYDAVDGQEKPGTNMRRFQNVIEQMRAGKLQPGIMIRFDQDGQDRSLLIDGWHRMSLATSMGVPMPVAVYQAPRGWVDRYKRDPDDGGWW
jgi:GNAT superfamily N-acetyltransferase